MEFCFGVGCGGFDHALLGYATIILFVIFLLFFVLVLFRVRLKGDSDVVGGHTIYIVLNGVVLLCFTHVGLKGDGIFKVGYGFPILRGAYLQFWVRFVGGIVIELFEGSTGGLPAVKAVEWTFASNTCFSRVTYVFTVTFNITPVPGPRMPTTEATTSWSLPVVLGAAGCIGVGVEAA